MVSDFQLIPLLLANPTSNESLKLELAIISLEGKFCSQSKSVLTQENHSSHLERLQDSLLL